MKIRSLAVVFLIIFMAVGCTGSALQGTEVPTATQTPVVEVQPGIYMSNDVAVFPFAASGYDVYIVGETHGNQETKELFQTYLRMLYKDAGVRDLVLEEHSAYEPDANEYVLGKTGALPEELCRRMDILGLIRQFNTTLLEDQKVNVHLVDVDSPLAIIDKHLVDLSTQLALKGISIQIPPLSEMEMWGPKSAYDLIASLQNAAADQPDVLKELAVLRMSFKWYFGSLPDKIRVEQKVQNSG
jgi:hypothetical protein